MSQQARGTKGAVENDAASVQVTICSAIVHCSVCELQYIFCHSSACVFTILFGQQRMCIFADCDRSMKSVKILTCTSYTVHLVGGGGRGCVQI